MQDLIDARERNQTVTLALEAERQISGEKQRELAEQQKVLSEKQQALAAERERAEKAQAELLRERNKPFYKRGWFWGGAAALVGVTLGVGLGVYGVQVRQSQTDGGTLSFAF